MAAPDLPSVLSAFHTFVQLHLFVFGVAAIWFMSGHTPKRRRLGFALGLYNQWAWWAQAIITDSWGLLAINVVYGVMYVRGLLNNPLLRDEVV